MGEPKKKPGRSRKNGTDWELRRYVMLLAAVIVLILIGAVADQVLFALFGIEKLTFLGRILRRHSGEKGWLTGRNGGYRRIWNGD